MYAKKGATVSLESFNSLTGILSGPVDLDEFNFSSSLSTIALSTVANSNIPDRKLHASCNFQNPGYLCLLFGLIRLDQY